MHVPMVLITMVYIIPHTLQVRAFITIHGGCFSRIHYTTLKHLYSTMMPNKRNMLLETIACLFLFPCRDVFQGQRLTSEANEHTYGLWRMILCEFNMEQLIRIVQKAIVKNDAMFESNFDAFRSNTMKGYPSGLQESSKICKMALAPVVLLILTRPSQLLTSSGTLFKVLDIRSGKSTN